ncbi:hypothetical protein [Streptomyces sp. PT12]|uniref:hypothetical protein n=1 Tax=Streptomyces sp. PT12 TaxID=1510197 RepID=UPI0015EECCED|nr:hypothetical protein [Streptomyces sp. PT12]
MAGAAALLALAPAGVAVAEEPPSFTIGDPRITESSGLAASRQHPGVYWTHNDQDTAPNLYAIDGASGATLATITLAGVTGRDIEAISPGPEGDLYVGDIGDNYDGGWDEVWIYRLPEPAELADATVTPTVYPVRYDDGPRDAEALMVHPETGRVYIVSKKRDGGAALYAGPAALTDAGANVFERAADIDQWVTDGAFSPDGTRLLLRGYLSARMYRWDAEAGLPEPLARRVIPPGGQLQGEAVTFTPDGAWLMFGAEGESSSVDPVELRGELLPESAASGGGDNGEEDNGEEDNGEAPDAARDPSGADGGDGGDGGDAEGNAGDGEDGDLTISAGLATTLVVGALLVLGVRRLLRGARGD